MLASPSLGALYSKACDFAYSTDSSGKNLSMRVLPADGEALLTLGLRVGLLAELELAFLFNELMYSSRSLVNSSIQSSSASDRSDLNLPDFMPFPRSFKFVARA